MKICGNYKSFLNDTLQPRNTAITAAGVSSASPLRRVPAGRVTTTTTMMLRWSLGHREQVLAPASPPNLVELII